MSDEQINEIDEAQPGEHPAEPCPCRTRSTPDAMFSDQVLRPLDPLDPNGPRPAKC
jgi:hypothetical protein